MSWHHIGFEEHRTHVLPTQLLKPYLEVGESMRAAGRMGPVLS